MKKYRKNIQNSVERKISIKSNLNLNVSLTNLCDV